MLFKKKSKIEVVPECDYSDFSHRVDDNAYATNKTLIAAATVPIVATAGLITYKITTTPSNSPTIIPTIAPISTQQIEPVLVQSPTTIPVIDMSSPEMIPTGFIAESSLDMLTTLLDPVVQILTAISFPIASVIMVGACFFFMIGNSEKGWQTIMNAGLGYVLIQMSPLFLQILREIGKAV